MQSRQASPELLSPIESMQKELMRLTKLDNEQIAVTVSAKHLDAVVIETRSTYVISALQTLLTEKGIASEMVFLNGNFNSPMVTGLKINSTVSVEELKKIFIHMTNKKFNQALVVPDALIVRQCANSAPAAVANKIEVHIVSPRMEELRQIAENNILKHKEFEALEAKLNHFFGEERAQLPRFKKGQLSNKLANISGLSDDCKEALAKHVMIRNGDIELLLKTEMKVRNADKDAAAAYVYLIVAPFHKAKITHYLQSAWALNEAAVREFIEGGKQNNLFMPEVVQAMDDFLQVKLQQSLERQQARKSALIAVSTFGTSALRPVAPVAADAKNQEKKGDNKFSRFVKKIF